jgi:hypothetical protein
LNWVDLYPINPQSRASFHQTFFSSQTKDDPVDSQLVEELVRTHGDRLRLDLEARQVVFPPPESVPTEARSQAVSRRLN